MTMTDNKKWTDEYYNFSTYDRNRLRESILRSNINFHHMTEKVLPGIIPQELPLEAIRFMGQCFMQLGDKVVYTQPNKRLRVVFPGGKEKKLPEIGVFLTTTGLDKLTDYHRLPLVLLSSYPAFIKEYGAEWSPHDGRLKDTVLGGIANMAEQPGNNTSQLLLFTLTSWILTGPMFDSFWRSRSFDIHFDAQFEPLIHNLIANIRACWGVNLDFYERNEGRFNVLRQQSDKRRNSSKICVGLGYNDCFVQQRIGNALIASGEIDEVVHKDLRPGWDTVKRCWDKRLDMLVSPEELLKAAEERAPAYAMGTNAFSSPHQSCYYGKEAAPRFVLRRAGIPLWNVAIDPPLSGIALSQDILCEAFAGIFTSPFVIELASGDEKSSDKKDISPTFEHTAFFPAQSYPPVFIEKQAAKRLEMPPSLKPVSGCLLALNIRKMSGYPPFIERFFFTLFSMAFTLHKSDMKKYMDFALQFLNYYPTLFLSNYKHDGYEDICKWYELSGMLMAMASSNKLATVAATEDYCEQNNIPFRFYNSSNWRPYVATDSWYGGITQGDLKELEGAGDWLRVSPNIQSYAEPFHEMREALNTGRLCTGVAYNFDGAQEEQAIKKCCYTDAASLHEKIAFAFDKPQDFRQAMEAAFWGSGSGVDITNTDEAKEVYRLFRRSANAPTEDEPAFRPASLSAFPKEILDMLASPRELIGYVQTLDIDAFVEQQVSLGVSRRFMQLHRAYWNL